MPTRQSYSPPTSTIPPVSPSPPLPYVSGNVIVIGGRRDFQLTKGYISERHLQRAKSVPHAFFQLGAGALCKG